MKMQTRNRNGSIGPKNRVRKVNRETRMSPKELNKCNEGRISEVENAGDDEVAVFAVAYANCTVQNYNAETQRQALDVLYLSADGEQMYCKIWDRTTPYNFDEVERAFTVAESEVHPADNVCSEFKQNVRRHPEVRDR